MNDVYVVDAVRTPIGRRGGGLAEIHPADLAAHVLCDVVERAKVDPAEVDDVIVGCIDQVGPQAGNIGRTAVLSAGYPEHVPGVTVHRACGSSQQALHFAAQGIRAGDYDIAVAAGVQNMSMVPMGSGIGLGEEAGLGTWIGGQAWRDRYGDQEFTQFRGAELIAEKWAITRRDMEELALASHERADRAWREGRFDHEVSPLAGVSRDEGIRADTTLEKMASLDTLSPEGRLTAAAASQISDGAAAVLVASEAAVERLGLTPRARIRAMSVVGSDPVMMLTGPIPATEKVLERVGLDLADIDLFEVNEAFAPVVLAWARETGASLHATNVNGGAIALGHPLGCSGVRLFTTLLHELERSGGRFGLETMCEGGGMANATIVEIVS